MSALSNPSLRTPRRSATTDRTSDHGPDRRARNDTAVRLVAGEAATTAGHDPAGHDPAGHDHAGRDLVGPAPTGWAGLPAPRRGQRAFDLVLALPLAVITLPVLVVGAVLSAVSFRARPFFTQDRLGEGGHTIRFVKLRTLPPTAPAAADKYRIAKVETTRVGRLLRKTKFDEVPQLWLVIAGHMSMVGPRPEMPTLAATFDPSFVAARTTVRPGITGLWQVSEAAGGLIGESPEYDLWYLANRSWRLDLWLLWRTLGPCLGWKPVTFDDVPAWCRRATASPALATAST